MDPALQGSLATGILGVVSLIVARIRCLYKRDDENNCSPICGSTEKSIQGNDDVEVHELTVGGTQAILLLPRK